MEGATRSSVRLLIAIASILFMAEVGRYLADCCRAVAAPIDDMLVNVNEDPPESLQLLPGIGPVIARRVVEQRSIRPFSDTADFEARVRGVGPTFLSSYGKWLRFDHGQGLTDTSELRNSAGELERTMAP